MIKTLAQNFASQKGPFSRKKRQISVQSGIFSGKMPQEAGLNGNFRSLLGPASSLSYSALWLRMAK
jgi:hypothetical protein